MRNSLELEAERRDMTVKELVKWALEKTHNPNAAAKLLNLERTSITNAMERYGLSVTIHVRVTEKEPA